MSLLSRTSTTIIRNSRGGPLQIRAFSATPPPFKFLDSGSFFGDETKKDLPARPMGCVHKSESLSRMTTEVMQQAPDYYFVPVKPMEYYERQKKLSAARQYSDEGKTFSSAGWQKDCYLTKQTYHQVQQEDALLFQRAMDKGMIPTMMGIACVMRMMGL